MEGLSEKQKTQLEEFIVFVMEPDLDLGYLGGSDERKKSVLRYLELIVTIIAMDKYIDGLGREIDIMESQYRDDFVAGQKACINGDGCPSNESGEFKRGFARQYMFDQKRDNASINQGPSDENI